MKSLILLRDLLRAEPFYSGLPDAIKLPAGERAGLRAYLVASSPFWPTALQLDRYSAKDRRSCISWLDKEIPKASKASKASVKHFHFKVNASKLDTGEVFHRQVNKVIGRIQSTYTLTAIDLRLEMVDDDFAWDKYTLRISAHIANTGLSQRNE